MLKKDIYNTLEMQFENLDKEQILQALCDLYDTNQLVELSEHLYEEYDLNRF